MSAHASRRRATYAYHARRVRRYRTGRLLHAAALTLAVMVLALAPCVGAALVVLRLLAGHWIGAVS